MTSQRQTTLCAVSGAPVFPYLSFRKAAPGGISALFLTALHPPAALWQEIGRLLIPIIALKIS